MKTRRPELDPERKSEKTLRARKSRGNRLPPIAAPGGASAGRWVRDVAIVGSRHQPGCASTFSAWAPDGLRENAALYLLMEHDCETMREIIAPLMASGAIPQGIILWSWPGSLTPGAPGAAVRRMRATQYDQPGTAFPDFLVEELVPAAEAALGTKVSPSPDLHFITGGSSGGFCAWNAAWYRNDFFHRVFLSSPSFLAMRGGEETMAIVRKCETRPIKAFVTLGSVEPDYFFGDSFYVAMNAVGALRHAGYDCRFSLFEHEGHCANRQDPALWNEMLPWLFDGWKTNPAVRPPGNPIRVANLLAEGSRWEPCDRAMPPPARETLSTDRGRRYRVASDSRFVLADTLDADGRATGTYALSTLHIAWNARQVGANALALLADDRVLVATELGVQGVVSFGITDLILPLPGDLPADNIAVEGRTLYVSSGAHVFRRELRIPAADPAVTAAPTSPGYNDGLDYSREHLPVTVECRPEAPSSKL